jgi:hypothetical protein
VNNEKKLRDFLQNQKELEKEKALKKQEKLEKRKRKREKLESTHHLFLDPNYDKQKQIISQDLDEALSKAVNMQRKRKLISSADGDTENSLQINHSDSNSNEETKTTTMASAELYVKPSTSSAADLALIAKLDVKKKVDSKEAGALEKKKEKQLDSLKGWMGVDYLDVSSSDEDEKDEPPKSN